MDTTERSTLPEQRSPPIEMSPEEFRAVGRWLVDRIADFLGRLPSGPLTPGEAPSVVRRALAGGGMPAEGLPADRVVAEAAELLFRHSLFNGHPRFLGYVTSSAAPIGALGDLLASAVNPNVGAWVLSPMATEIEQQVVRWVAELIGYPVDCGGLLVSGGNAANFTGFLAASRAKAGEGLRERGLPGQPRRLLVYASEETHTWIQKAADLFGFGTDSIRWVPVDAGQRLEMSALERMVASDRAAGGEPFMVVGSAGTVSTGAVDPLAEMAAFCRRAGLWFHVDGAYGAIAAAVPGAADQLAGLAEADSVAVDPHKWLYCPLEAGCALVRDGRRLERTFSFHPAYYHFDQAGGEVPLNYFELGLQNSRGFRALKVWLVLRQAGREGVVRLVQEDMALARELYRLVSGHPELEAGSCGLSIATFRYVPPGVRVGSPEGEEYLNRLNRELVTRLQRGGEAFLSNAVVRGRFFLRACVVNFRTNRRDVAQLPELVVRVGREAAEALSADGSSGTA